MSTSPIFKQYKLSLAKEISPGLQVANIEPFPDGGILIQFKGSRQVSRYDPQFNFLWRKEIGILQGEFEQFSLTVSPDGKFIGMHANKFVCIFDDNGNLLHCLEHEPWQFHQGSGCYFAPPNSEGKKYIWFFVPENGGGGYLKVLDRSDFSLVGGLWQEDIDYYYRFFGTPNNNKVFIDLAAGQDGSRLLEAQVVDKEIQLKEYYQCSDRAMGNFSPTGKEIVFAPQFENEIEIFSFPEMEKIVGIEQEELFESRDEFPGANLDRVRYIVYYLSATTLMVMTEYGRLLLIDRNSLRCTGEIILDGFNINAFDHIGNTDPTIMLDYTSEIFDLKLTGAGQLVVIHVSNVIKIYDLPISLLSMDRGSPT
jgi:hypothetical protein